MLGQTTPLLYYDARLLSLIRNLGVMPGLPYEPYMGLGPSPQPPFPGAWFTPAGDPLPRGSAGDINGRALPPLMI